MKIPIVVNIFDRYNIKKIKWAGIFQIMTYIPNMKLPCLNLWLGEVFTNDANDTNDDT